MLGKHSACVDVYSCVSVHVCTHTYIYNGYRSDSINLYITRHKINLGHELPLFTKLLNLLIE